MAWACKCAIKVPSGAGKTEIPVKTLALAFLVMIGVLLVADGLGQHLPRGYVYFAMLFSLLVEVINLRAGARRPQVATS